MDFKNSYFPIKLEQSDELCFVESDFYQNDPNIWAVKDENFEESNIELTELTEEDEFLADTFVPHNLEEQVIIINDDKEPTVFQPECLATFNAPKIKIPKKKQALKRVPVKDQCCGLVVQNGQLFFNAVNPDTVNSKTVNTKTLNLKTVNSKSVKSKNTNSKTVTPVNQITNENCKPIYFFKHNPHSNEIEADENKIDCDLPVYSKRVNLKTMNSKRVNLNTVIPVNQITNENSKPNYRHKSYSNVIEADENERDCNLTVYSKRVNSNTLNSKTMNSSTVNSNTETPINQITNENCKPNHIHNPQSNEIEDNEKEIDCDLPVYSKTINSNIVNSKNVNSKSVNPKTVIPNTVTPVNQIGGLMNEYCQPNYINNSHSNEMEDDENEIGVDCDFSMYPESMGEPESIRAEVVTVAKKKTSLIKFYRHAMKGPSRKEISLRFQPPEKLHRCKVCGELFVSVSNLKNHMRIHTGEKNFVCEICNTAFAQSSNLTAHVRIHTGERPYKCKLCDKRFLRSSHVTSHILWKHKHISKDDVICFKIEENT